MHAMQVPNINNYLVDDTVFNAINKLFLSLNQEEVKRNNIHLDEALSELIKLMKSQDALFNKTFNRIEWTGSFYKKTKIESPDEFDLNFVIQLPIEEKDMKLIADERYPGYVKICTMIDKASQCRNSKMSEQEYQKMMSFVDNGALNQEKFRRWIEGVLNKVANITSQSNQIKIRDYTIIIKKSGPAFTLLLPDIPNKSVINIDLVPVLSFSYSCLPPHYKNKNYDLQSFEYFAVPKPLRNNNACDENYYWRLSFYKHEKNMLSKYGQIKPVIRHLKKLKETQGWKSIASYYIETLCFHNIQMLENCGKISYTCLFFTMLQELLKAFRQKRINHYLDKRLNLLENIGDLEMINMEGRLSSIIKDIERHIADDRFAIAKYILNREELRRLRNELTTVPNTSEILEPGSESMDQGRCMIV